MRWPAPAIGLTLIALASSVLVIGCASVTVWEVRPEAAARAVRHVVGQRPLGQPGSPGTGSADPARPAGPDAALVQAQVSFDEARRRELLSRDAALRLYAGSMAFAWESMGGFDVSGPGRDRARSIYNRALDRFLRVAGGHRLRPDASWCAEMERRGIRVTVGRDPLLWDPDRFDELRFAGDYVVCGMDHYYGCDGVGVPLIAVRRPSREELDRREGPDRFYPYWEVYPVTAVLRFDSAGVGPVLELHDTLRSTQIQTGAGMMPIAADLTTPTAYHFACGRLSSYERLSLFTPQRLVREAGLHMLQPYERGKIPVVLIHGLGSSPMSWGQVVNELRGDPALRARYQFWSYMYPTGNPFMLSAAELRRSLTEARAAVNPDHSDPACDRMVLVGHSMGGLLSKLVISESGDALWRLNSPQPFDRLVANDAHRDLLGRVFFFRPLPFVGHRRLHRHPAPREPARQRVHRQARRSAAPPPRPARGGPQGGDRGESAHILHGRLPRGRPFQHRRADIRKPLPVDDRPAAASPGGEGPFDRRPGRPRPARDQLRRRHPVFELAPGLGRVGEDHQSAPLPPG